MFEKLKSTWETVRAYPYIENAKTLILETPVEVFIGAGLFASVFASYSYHQEDAKGGKIPLAFSEIDHNRNQFRWFRNQDVPPLTNYYSVTNDVAMMAFEGNNLGYAWNEWSDFWDRTDRIAYEMEKKIEPTMRVHTLISDYAPQFPKISKEALASVDKLVKAEKDLPELIEALDEAWEDEHDDKYRTEVYTVSVCTSRSNGQGGTTTSCSPQIRTRQVYDHTDHYYTYNKAAGNRAAFLLKDFIQKHPDFNIEEKLHLVNTTNAENEWAIRQSRRDQDGIARVAAADYVAIANTWATGSNFNVYMPKIHDAFNGVSVRTPEWDRARKTSKNHSYSTHSRSDSGPEEFQVAESALSYAVGLSNSSHKITDGMRIAGQKIPELNSKMKQFVDATLHGGPGDPEELRDEVMTTARQIYKANYAGGFDTDPSKWGMVFLWGFLGALGGGALGFGADRLIHRKYGTGKKDPDTQGYHYR